jgi:hypothetical protein
MTSKPSISLCLLLVLAAPGALALGDKSCKSPADRQAIDLLKAKVRSERLYAPAAEEGCLMYYPVQCDAAAAHVAVREFHSPRCGGDPRTASILGNFRIDKKTKVVQWYDDEEDEYVEFSRVHSADDR